MLTQLQLQRRHKLCHSFYIGFGNQSKNAILPNWPWNPKRKGLPTKTGKLTRKSGSFHQNTPITAYRSRIEDICGPSLGPEDRDVASKKSVSVDASNLSGLFQVPCAHQALIGAHYLSTLTICILISAHTIHHMGIIQTVNHLVHLVPFLLTLQLYHPSQNITRMSRPQNVYYHPDVSCIRCQNPSFVALSYCHCMKSTWRTTLGGIQLLSNFQLLPCVDL